MVIPHLKKPTLELECKNYRPVSSLQFVSKLVERAVVDQLSKHMQDNDLYPVMQSAYRKYHSAETALLKVKNDFLHSMDDQQATMLVLLDLSAAFDTVNHNILLRTLQDRLGVNSTALEWFSSYLRNRSQRILVKGHKS